MVELAEHGAAVRVAAFHEALHAGEEPVVVERAVSPGGMVGTPCDGGYDHKPDPAGGDGFVKVNDPVPGRAVVLKNQLDWGALIILFFRVRPLPSESGDRSLWNCPVLMPSPCVCRMYG